MKILLIGGGGFLGSELALELSKVRTNQIQVLDIFTHGFPKKVKKKKNIHPPVIASINNFRDILRVMERFRPDVVFHLAAFNSRPETFGNFRACAEVNYLGTANIIYAITSLKQPPKRFIFASTLAAQDPQSHYGISKKAAEDLIQTTLCRFTEYDVQVNILRFAEIYGSSSVHSSTSMVNFIVDNMLLGNDLAMYGVQEKIDCLHISDAVSACCAVLSKDCKVPLLDIGTGFPISILEIIEQVKNLTGFQGRLRYLDNPKVPVKTYTADIKLAKEFLDFCSQTDFERSLADLVKKRRKVIG